MARSGTFTRRVCAACGDELPGAEVYFRFALAIQGELDVLDDGAPDASDPQAIAAQLEKEAQWGRYEDDVHWESSGVVCVGCRKRLIAMLTGRAVGAH